MYVDMDGFGFTGFPDASTVGFPDASVEASVEDEEENILFILPNTPPDDVEFPDASVELPDASEEEENIFPNIPDPDAFPDGSVVVFPDGSEENGDERLNASLFDENNVLI